MHADIFRLDLGLRRRSLLACAAGMALYAIIIVALYPQFEHSASLDNITRNAPGLAAVFGAVGMLTSPAGWLDANLYANFFPLVMLLLTIGYGASAIAGQDADGTLALVAALPVSRIRILIQKALALAAQAAVIACIVAACVLAGRSFNLTVSASHIAGISLAVFLLGADLGLIALAVGAATGSRGAALGTGTAAAAASYLISSLAPVIAWIRPARYASLFYWSVGNQQLTRGLSPADLAVLAAVAIAAFAAAAHAFKKLDLH